MKKLSLVVLLVLSSCVVTVRQRPVNPDGTLAPFSEEMEKGAEDCAEMCMRATPSRLFQEYRRDGKCVCRPPAN